MELENRSGSALVARGWAYVMASICSAVGCGLLLGGPLRFSGASFAFAGSLAPWWGWGLLFLLGGGIFGWTVRFRPCQSLLAAIAPGFAFAALGTTLAITLPMAPTAAGTGVPVYMGLMVSVVTSGWFVKNTHGGLT